MRQEPNNSVYLASCIGLKCNNLEHYDVYITVPIQSLYHQMYVISTPVLHFLWITFQTHLGNHRAPAVQQLTGPSPAAAASRELGSFRNPHSKLPTKSVGKLPILQVLVVLFSPYFPLFLILPSGLTHHLRFVKYKKWLISANLTLK